MRFHEIVESAANLPAKYEMDPDTDLAMNLPKQWSQSPYLGAVKGKSSGYMAQVHIPQATWTAMVDHNPSKWKNAPESFFNDTGNRRPAMIVSGFKDPRRAAWVTQEILYGGQDPREYIEDYFDERYNGGSGEVWRALIAQAPQFEGKPLDASDEENFFAHRDPVNPQVIQKKNSAEYDRVMPQKIKKALVDFYSKNRQLAKKRLGSNSLNDLEAKIDALIDQKGVDFFVTSPGSIKLKDIPSLNF